MHVSLILLSYTTFGQAGFTKASREQRFEPVMHILRSMLPNLGRHESPFRIHVEYACCPGINLGETMLT